MGERTFPTLKINFYFSRNMPLPSSENIANEFSVQQLIELARPSLEPIVARALRDRENLAPSQLKDRLNSLKESQNQSKNYLCGLLVSYLIIFLLFQELVENPSSITTGLLMVFTSLAGIAFFCLHQKFYKANRELHLHHPTDVIQHVQDLYGLIHGSPLAKQYLVLSYNKTIQGWFVLDQEIAYALRDISADMRDTSQL